MNVKELFGFMNENDIKLFLRNGSLCVEAPKNLITQEIKTSMIRQKQNIIEVLECFPDFRDAIFQRDEKEAVLPTYAQERLWTFQKTIPGHEKYLNTHMAFSLQGELDTSAIKKSVYAIIERHEALRTRFLINNGRLEVDIRKETDINFLEYDLSVEGKLLEPLEEEAGKLIFSEIRRPFDLEKDLLARALLVKVRPRFYKLIFIFSNLVTDGWSAKVFHNELKQLYTSIVSGMETDIPTLPVQYYDYAMNIRSTDYKKRYKNSIDFWINTLKGVPAEIDFAIDYRRNTQKSFEGKREKFFFDNELVYALKKVCKQEKVTLFVMMLTIVDFLIYKYSNNNDFAVFVPVINRDNKPMQNLVGLFDNLLIFRTKINKESSVIEHLIKVKDKVYAAFEHQALPFEIVVQELKIIPKFQVQISMLDKSMRKLELPGIQAELLEVDLKTCMCDMEIYFWESEAGLQGHIQYSKDLFKDETMKRITYELHSIANLIARDSEQKIADLGLRTEAPSINNSMIYKKLRKEINSICSGLLEIEKVCLKKSFYELGGHSFSFIKFLSILEDRYKIKYLNTDAYSYPIERIIADIIHNN